MQYALLCIFLNLVQRSTKTSRDQNYLPKSIVEVLRSFNDAPNHNTEPQRTTRERRSQWTLLLPCNITRKRIRCNRNHRNKSFVKSEISSKIPRARNQETHPIFDTNCLCKLSFPIVETGIFLFATKQKDSFKVLPYVTGDTTPNMQNHIQAPANRFSNSFDTRHRLLIASGV